MKKELVEIVKHKIMSINLGRVTWDEVSEEIIKIISVEIKKGLEENYAPLNSERNKRWKQFWKDLT